MPRMISSRDYGEANYVLGSSRSQPEKRNPLRLHSLIVKTPFLICKGNRGEKQIKTQMSLQGVPGSLDSLSGEL